VIIFNLAAFFLCFSLFWLSLKRVLQKSLAYCIVLLNNSLCVSHPGSRLFPVLPGNGRITQDDLVVGGYFIPKGVRRIETLVECAYAEEKKFFFFFFKELAKNVETRCNTMLQYSHISVGLLSMNECTQLFTLRNVSVFFLFSLFVRLSWPCVTTPHL